jgi:hypothetical protein
MPRGRKPTGDRALTGAERQALYRAAHTGRPLLRPLRGASPRAKAPSSPRRRSRPQRWHEAVFRSEWVAAFKSEYRPGFIGFAGTRG